MNAVIAFEVRLMLPADVESIPRAFAAAGWPGKEADLYRRYLSEQDRGARSVRVATAGTECLGYVTVLWDSRYVPFRDNGIPEISDLNVLPQYRRQRVGTALMDAAESVIAERSVTAGLGVGLYADYAAAHRMYLKRGYLPDGQGIAYEFKPVAPGTTVRVDDDLNLMMTRLLR
jgi:GNAT superfamily N-acetyltransferase